MGACAIVLVRGAFADGSGWQGVYPLLSKDGYSVSVVQNPTLSLAGGVAHAPARPHPQIATSGDRQAAAASTGSAANASATSWASSGFGE
ncbi:MAG: hydrolase [Solirubrobacterales bacterium]|nr:hydrolase [Solirubrobacterales bacterium]